MVKKLMRGHYWTFLGNHETRAKAEASAKAHKKVWGGKTAITTTVIGKPLHKDYLLWWR